MYFRVYLSHKYLTIAYFTCLFVILRASEWGSNIVCIRAFRKDLKKHVNEKIEENEKGWAGCAWNKAN